MDKKITMALAVMVFALAFIGLSAAFDESEAATIDAKTFYNSHSDGDTVYYEYQSITITDVTEGLDEYFCIPSTFTLSASNPSQVVTVYNTYDNDPDLSDSYNVTFIGTAPVVNYTVSIVAGTGGNVSGDTSFSVPSGTSVSASGSTISVGSYSATASANPNYTFSSWSQSSGTITGNTTITASFTYTPPSPTYYSVSIVAGTGGNVSGDTSFSVESGTSVSASGSTISVGSYSATASANPNYTFSSWSQSSGTITGNTTITASFTYTPPAPSTYTVTFAVSPSGYGTVSQNYIYNVPSGASISASDNIVTINGTTVTATPIDATSGYAYSFSSWSNTSGPVTADRTITANFTSTAVDYILSAEDLALAPGTTSYYYSSGGTIAINDVIDGLQEYLARPSLFTLDSNNPSQVVTVYDNYDDDPDSSTSFNVTFYYRSATHTVTVISNDSDYGGVSTGGTPTASVIIQNVPDGASITVSDNTITVNGTTVTATASQPSGGYTYSFSSWSNTSGTVTDDRTVTANFISTAIQTVFMHVNVGSGSGSVYVTDNNGNTSPTSTDSTYVYLEVPMGTTITIHAIPDTGYAFQSWGSTPFSAVETFTINANTSLSANFVPISLSYVWWYNGYTNGSVEVAFDFTSTSRIVHEMSIPLVSYDGIEDNGDGIKYFSLNGYIITITNSYNANITCSVTKPDHTTVSYTPYLNGNWNEYVLKIDVQKGTITFQGIEKKVGADDFTFLDYAELFEKVIFDISDTVNNMAISKIYHEDTGTGDHPHFQVTATTTFLDTYGFVMVDPTLNIYDKFPNFNDLRLNLYSFAYYGDGITINNHHFDMDGSVVQGFWYLPKGSPIYEGGQIVGYAEENMISSEGVGSIELKPTLNNVYITWTNINSLTESDRICRLTFVNEDITINMGTFASGDLTISFDGIWYFTTAIYEPYIGYENVYTMDWNSPFNLSKDAFILVYIGLSILLFLVMNLIYKPGLLDYAIVIGAGVIGYIIL